MSEKRKTIIYLFLILLLGAALRFWGINWGLPYEYQTEEYKVIKYALRMGSGDLNPHFFEYPTLYLYFMFFLYGLYFVFGKIFGVFANIAEFAQQFVRDPSCFYLIGRGMESLFGLGVVFMTYFIGKKVFSKKIGLVAALCMTVLGSAINTAHVTKGDMAAIFLGLIFWFFSYGIYETGEKKYYILSGIFLGLTLSTKYYLALMGMTLPMAHLLSERRTSHKNFIISIVFAGCFFIIGSPYAVFSSEAFNELKGLLLFFGSGAKKWEPTKFQIIFQQMGTVTVNFIRMIDNNPLFLIGNIGLGIFNFSGLILLFFKERKKSLLFIPLIVFHWIVVGTCTNPAAGYLAPLFPLLMLCGSYFIFSIISDNNFFFSSFKEKEKLWFKRIVLLLFCFSWFSAFGNSIIISYAHTLKDVRTLSKDWIETNIPSKNKILMDLLTYSPPIRMTKEQLERLYLKAVRINSYKKEYFKLKLETCAPDNPGYEIYVIKRSAKEIGSLPSQVEQVQQVQDLIDLSGNDEDFKNLKQAGIKYVITNSWAEDDARRKSQEIGNFYQKLPAHSELLRTFAPESKYSSNLIIKIYKIR